MSVSVSPRHDHAIIERLRAAGCVFAEDEARLLCAAAPTTHQLSDLVEQRASGTPLEHILGWCAFCGLRIQLDRDVFIPRPRTEFLVRLAGSLTRAGSVVVDLCCGSGAIGAAVVAALPTGSLALHAVDIDPVAVRCARRNLDAIGAVYEGDLFEALPQHLRGTIDVLVANAPYVPTDQIDMLPREAREYEPHVALDGGSEGLDVQRRISDGARHWLAPGGHVLIETSVRQAPLTLAAFTHAGLDADTHHWEELDATVVIGRRSSGPFPRS